MAVTPKPRRDEDGSAPDDSDVVDAEIIDEEDVTTDPEPTIPIRPVPEPLARSWRATGPGYDDADRKWVGGWTPSDRVLDPVRPTGARAATEDTVERVVPRDDASKLGVLLAGLLIVLLGAIFMVTRGGEDINSPVTVPPNSTQALTGPEANGDIIVGDGDESNVVPVVPTTQTTPTTAEPTTTTTAPTTTTTSPWATFVESGTAPFLWQEYNDENQENYQIWLGYMCKDGMARVDVQRFASRGYRVTGAAAVFSDGTIIDLYDDRVPITEDGISFELLVTWQQRQQDKTYVSGASRYTPEQVRNTWVNGGAATNPNCAYVPPTTTTVEDG